MCLFGWKSIYNLANHELRIAIYTPAYLNSRRRNGVTSFTETRNGKNVNQPLKHYRKLTYSLCFNIRKKTQWPSQARLRIADSLGVFGLALKRFSFGSKRLPSSRGKRSAPTNQVLETVIGERLVWKMR